MNLDKNFVDDKFRGFMKSAEDSSGKPGDGEQLVNWQLLECFLFFVVFLSSENHDKVDPCAKTQHLGANEQREVHGARDPLQAV